MPNSNRDTQSVSSEKPLYLEFI